MEPRDLTLKVAAVPFGRVGRTWERLGGNLLNNATHIAQHDGSGSDALRLLGNSGSRDPMAHNRRQQNKNVKRLHAPSCQCIKIAVHATMTYAHEMLIPRPLRSASLFV